MANTGFKGVDVRQTGNQLVFRAFLQDSSGAKVTTGTTSLSLYELQSDGTLKSYDFNDNTFKTTALTTATASMTHRTGNNATVNTGVWTYALSTLTGFTVGAAYLVAVNNSGASPTDQTREFQYGSGEGDLAVTSTGTGTAALTADVTRWLTAAVNALQSGRVDSYPGATPATMIFNNTGQTTAVPADLRQIIGAILSEVNLHGMAAGFMKLLDVATPTKTINDIATDSSGVTTLLGLLTSARAGYLDNLNVGGQVASHADIAAINQSASKHMTLATVGQYAPGETYTIEMRTYQASDGAAVNADTTPTVTATGNVSGSLAANLSAATNPATGVYRWTYTPGATPTLEQIRLDGSAMIASATFTLSAYTQTVDEPTAVFTATDKSNLTTLYNLRPAFTPLIDSAGKMALTTAEHTGIAGDVESGLTAHGYTTTRAPKLDYLTRDVATDATLASFQPNYAPAKAGDGMTLTGAEHAALAGVFSTQMISDHGSGSYVRNTEPDNATIATAATNAANANTAATAAQSAANTAATTSAAIKVVTDKQATELENDPANPGKSRMTVASLVNAPSGGGGGGGTSRQISITQRTVTVKQS